VEAPQFDVDVETERGRTRLGNGRGVDPPEHRPDPDREWALGRRGQANRDERGADHQEDDKRLPERPHAGVKANSVPYAESWDRVKREQKRSAGPSSESNCPFLGPARPEENSLPR
jgi:hypothetical protein